jgi:DNA helicase HerA-like ATPase
MGREVALLDDLLLKAAAGGKSGVEIERLTGIPAAEAVQHVKQLLATRDIWSEHEQRQLLLTELHELKDSLQSQALKAKDIDSARLLLKTLELIGRRLDSEQAVLDENLIKLSRFQEQVLLRAMDSALSFAKRELAERYPEVSVVDLEAIVADGLVRAKFEILEEEQI